jgi:hypothetical protein
LVKAQQSSVFLVEINHSILNSLPISGIPDSVSTNVCINEETDGLEREWAGYVPNTDDDEDEFDNISIGVSSLMKEIISLINFALSLFASNR